jgi:hypothetical protein
MPSVVIQFRMAEEEVRLLRRHGYEPNALARERMMGVVQSLRSSEADKELRKLLPTPLGIDVERAFRESRRELEDRS